ncbi:LOW QUALITY PROTEIN: hypothetical protein Cgig2_024413 [Carnegiea gigantea]|uniref:Uncharacterized protein n=1 Tax=Carnegiea gigantea TaxID=171969 RepID=A0A9Q1KL24_9CARY|nr:LOW QUALITY PROTEIN: hypothetical protein Cgig2_024413 [Carnegiea gigantea]
MAGNLEEAWSRLSLTEEEATVVEFEEEAPTEKKEEIALSLLGKLLTDTSFNARVVKTVLRNIWKSSKRLVVRDLHNNLFWVKAYDVPGMRQTKKILGSQIRTIVDCEDSTMFGAGKSLCFWVDMGIERPLQRGVNVKMDGKLMWIRSNMSRCQNFGTAVGASPLKSRRRNAELALQEEKQLILAYQNKGGSTKSTAVKDKEVQRGENSQSKPVHMVIDEHATITPSREAFKRKLDGSKGRTLSGVLWGSKGGLKLSISGPPKSQAEIDSFRDAFVDNGLFDLGYKGYELIWATKAMSSHGTKVLGGSVVIEEGLDRFCASVEWLLFYPEATVHLDSDLSNHLPILLKCYPRRASQGQREKSFRFENMWCANPSYMDIIKEAWDANGGMDAVSNYMIKAEQCTKALQRWNTVRFGHVGTYLRQLEGELWT